MFVFPVRRDVTAPGGVHALRGGPGRRRRAARRRGRRQPRGLDRRVDRPRGPVTVRGTGPARRAAAPRRWRSSPCFFAWPVANIVGEGLRGDHGVGAPRRRRRAGRRRAAARGLVHPVAGGGVHRAHARARPARRPRAGPLRVPGAASGPGARDRPVRAADGGGGRRVPRAARSERRPRPRPGRHRVGDPPGPRLLQPRGGRAHRRRAVGAPRPGDRVRRPRARGVTVAGGARGHPPGAAPGHHLRRTDHVPLHVHVVRRGAAPGRPGPRDPRGRDLPPDRGPARPARGRRPRPPAAPRRRSACWSCRSGSPAAGVGRRSRLRPAAPPTGPGGGALVGRGEPRAHGGVPGRRRSPCWSSARSAPGDGYGLATVAGAREHRAGPACSSPPLEAVANSLRFAAVATVVAVVLGGLAATALVRSARAHRRGRRRRRSCCRSAPRRSPSASGSSSRSTPRSTSGRARGSCRWRRPSWRSRSWCGR